MIQPCRAGPLRFRFAIIALKSSAHPESGAKATALQTLARLPGICELREAFGLPPSSDFGVTSRRIHRRSHSPMPLRRSFWKYNFNGRLRC